ncbi:methyltransferase [Arthrobacter sp. SW1]|uniref:MT-A70 family methyltransferase n=1 Tax=Arthrobacter sp. SW1 TaxID=1920889 RepID=UPI000877C519|nr:MT-A70 family methyltransferase [Arthrobacter sp. SW1]OFI39544.1 methyltransferase [Arthrobacter sp. SW1]
MNDPITNLHNPAEDPFDVILADPPWDAEQKGRLGAARHYDLMTLEKIKGMGPAIQALTKPDAHCWLWVTNATLRAGYDVLEAWGFTARSPLTWVKPVFGLGNYLRNASEHVLLGTRGKAPVRYKSQPTWMFLPRMEHSRKPDELYSVIDRVSGPDTRKLELFARRRPPAPNWSVWGNEVDSDVSLAAYGYAVPSDLDERLLPQTAPEGRDA